MATSPTVATRDDDPPHPNLDGIRFQATTDQTGIIAVPMSADSRPPVSYLPVPFAVATGAELGDLIMRIRRVDPHSYLATFLDGVLEDLTDAIDACRPQEAT